MLVKSLLLILALMGLLLNGGLILGALSLALVVRLPWLVTMSLASRGGKMHHG